jgi:hypothetical protein
MVDGNANRHEMREEDGQRMLRLSEEVRSRLMEMALITARAAGKRISDSAGLRFVPHSAGKPMDADAGAGDWVEIGEADDGSSVCYGVINGHPFAESPCGATP